MFWCHSCIPIHFGNFDPQEKIVFIVFTIFVVHEILKIFLQSINQSIINNVCSDFKTRNKFTTAKSLKVTVKNMC